MPHPSPSSHTLNVFRQDWTAETSNQIFPLYDAILQYTVETLLLDPNVLRDSILVRMELMQFGANAVRVETILETTSPYHLPSPYNI